ERLDTLWQTEPIPVRRQNHGYYLIPSLTLRPELAPGLSGLAVHLRSE
ncbi:flavodoxin family protein, partial [Klebsiella pneumoniae]|nr:flavodoxin family protein [Klebsiella pneumoniae]